MAMGYLLSVAITRNPFIQIIAAVVISASLKPPDVQEVENKKAINVSSRAKLTSSVMGKGEFINIYCCISSKVLFDQRDTIIVKSVATSF